MSIGGNANIRANIRSAGNQFPRNRDRRLSALARLDSDARAPAEREAGRPDEASRRKADLSLRVNSVSRPRSHAITRVVNYSRRLV